MNRLFLRCEVGGKRIIRCSYISILDQLCLRRTDPSLAISCFEVSNVEIKICPFSAYLCSTPFPMLYANKTPDQMQGYRCINSPPICSGASSILTMLSACKCILIARNRRCKRLPMQLFRKNSSKDHNLLLLNTTLSQAALNALHHIRRNLAPERINVRAINIKITTRTRQNNLIL
jgi:hypothetical protein